jgi:hypothetical protein
MGPSARYVRDLLAKGYVGQIRSVRMHVSMNYFQAHRPRDLAWTVPAENFSHILSIYGGHFIDMLFHVVGAAQTVSAVVVNQFPTITITDNDETLPNTTPDQVLVIGTLANGGLFTIQIEGGKRNNSGLQIDITGMKVYPSRMRKTMWWKVRKPMENRFAPFLSHLVIPRFLPQHWMPACSIWPTCMRPTRTTAKRERIMLPILPMR